MSAGAQYRLVMGGMRTMANLLKMALIETIFSLHQRGWSRRRIARELGIDRETVARYLLGGRQNQLLRITPELHRLINQAESVSGQSVNTWVAEQLQAGVAGIKSAKAIKGKRKPRQTEKRA